MSENLIVDFWVCNSLLHFKSSFSAHFSSAIRPKPVNYVPTKSPNPTKRANSRPNYWQIKGSIEPFSTLPINPIVEFIPYAKESIHPQNHQVVITLRHTDRVSLPHPNMNLPVKVVQNPNSFLIMNPRTNKACPRIWREEKMINPILNKFDLLNSHFINQESSKERYDDIRVGVSPV